MRLVYLIIFIFLLNITGVFGQDPVKTAIDFIRNNYNNGIQNKSFAEDPLEFNLSSLVKPVGQKFNYIYFNQKLYGIEIFNAVYNVVVDQNNQVSYSIHTFKSLHSGISKPDLKRLISQKEAIFNALEITGRKIDINQLNKLTQRNENVFQWDYQGNIISITQQWLPKEYLSKERFESLYLTWLVTFEGENNEHWMAHTDAYSGEILRLQDQVLHCDFGEINEKSIVINQENQPKNINSLNTSPNTYEVFDIPVESPIYGTRTLVSEPYERFAPAGTGPGITNGWHSDGINDYSYTRGNNVWAYEDTENKNIPGYYPESNNMNFVFPYYHGLNTANDNQNAAITNLFYWTNLLHDILYQYGFDEPSGNFQSNNMGRGGEDGDPLLAEAQDGKGTNNANISITIDGESPRMQMYLWTEGANYQPDGDFDNLIISHEYAHGWSTRLTGGPLNASCLFNNEQPGEGWSDYLGLMMTTDWSGLNPDISDANIERGVGNYVKNYPVNGVGIRPYPYSYDMANVNPKVTYGAISTEEFGSVHKLGSIWATVLWDLTWEIIFQDNEIEPDISNTSNMVGNVATLKLVHEGLRLQPCSPSLVDARDAIIMADSLFFGGKYACAISLAFSRRGLGYYASTGESVYDNIVFEDFTPIIGPKLTSTKEITVCSGAPIAYTATSDIINPIFNWERKHNPGISNAAGYGTGSLINESLINTTEYPVTVEYIVYITPIICGTEPFGEILKVTVLPDSKPIISEIKLCKDETLENGEGFKGKSIPMILPTEINTTFSLNSGSPSFNRFTGSGTDYYYYKSFTYTATVKGIYKITQKKETSTADPYLYVYSNFNANEPGLGLLDYDDDGDGTPNAKIIINLDENQTIYIVATDYFPEKPQTYSLKVEPDFTVFPQHAWYLTQNSITPLATSEVFNPIGLNGSGIPDTGTPGNYTFYYSSDLDRLCKTAINLVIDTPTSKGKIEDLGSICTGAPVSIKLSDFSGQIIQWEVSNDNFTTIDTIQSQGNPFSPVLNQNESQFRAYIKAGTCPGIYSDVISVKVTQNHLDITQNYNNEITADKATESIEAKNKINQTSEIIYKAGKSIELLPGFEVKSQAVFKAIIEQCP